MSTDPAGAIIYLDSRQAASVLGLQPQTFRAMRSAGKAPDPDVMIGRQPGWSPKTIERERAKRERRRER